MEERKKPNKNPNKQTNPSKHHQNKKKRNLTFYNYNSLGKRLQFTLILMRYCLKCSSLFVSLPSIQKFLLEFVYKVSVLIFSLLHGTVMISCPVNATVSMFALFSGKFASIPLYCNRRDSKFKFPPLLKIFQIFLTHAFSKMSRPSRSIFRVELLIWTLYFFCTHLNRRAEHTQHFTEAATSTASY